MVIADHPPAIVHPLAGKPCIVTGTVRPIIGHYDGQGRCVLDDPSDFRPAEEFDLKEKAGTR